MVSSLDNWDGGLSKTVKPNSNRMTGSSNPGMSSTLNTIQDERINGWNFTNDASNLNQPLSRHGLVVPIVTAPNGITTSPAWKTLTPSHGQKIGSSPVLPTPAVATVTSSSRSPMIMDKLETISTYSADGEGDDEAEVEEITVVHDMISSISPTREQNLSHPTTNSPLFLSEEDSDSLSVNHLFTPCPSPKQTQAELPSIHHRPPTRRLIMSHIQVPPLKRPRSDYQPFRTTHSTIVNKRRVPPEPLSMAQVLQRSFQQNADVGVLLYSSEKKKRKLTKDRESNAVAGPSSTKKKLKRSFTDNDEWGAPPRSKKWLHPTSASIVVDLTITDDDERVEKPKVKPKTKIAPNPIPKSSPKPRPAKFIHAAYNSETDTVTMCLEDIRPLPLEVLTLNTRFVRQSLENANKGVPEGNKLANVDINRTTQNGSRPCLLSIATNSSSTEDAVEEMSVGGIIWELSEENIEREVIEISSDSDPNLKENVPQRQPSTPQVLSTSNVGLKSQHQKKSQASRHIRQQPKQRRQLVSDEVDRSSSIFSTKPPSTPPGPFHASPGQRPPHSARSSLKGYNPDSGSDYPNGFVPSAKALGKRRAISPTTDSPQRQYPDPVPLYFATPIRDVQLPLRSPSTIPPPLDPYAVQNSDFNTFINYSATFPPAMQSPPLSTSYISLDTSYLYDPSSSNQNLHIGSEMDTHPLDTHSPTRAPTLVYNSQSQPESRGESFFSSASSLYNDAGFPGNEHDATINQSWSASLATTRSEDQYAYETIDPTLLGGGGETEQGPEMDVDLVDGGLELETDQQKDSNHSEFGHSRASSPSSFTDSSSSSSSSGSIKAKKKSRVSTSTKHVQPADDDDKEREENRRKLPPRIRTKRILPNMISHDEIDLLTKSKSKSKSKLRFSSSSANSADKSGSDSEKLDYESDDEDEVVTVRKPIPKPRLQKHPRPVKSVSPPVEPKKVIVISQVDKNRVWQMEKEDAYCHQCRRKTFYAKMTCSNCQKKFCVRCYAFRYPDHKFDADDEQYSCPACEGFCNCTHCCRKRGETYVGVRNPVQEQVQVPDSPSLPPQRPRNTDVIRVKPSGKTNLPRPAKATVIPTTPIPEGATQAWGSLYSVTGEKIGACFFDPSAEKVAPVVFAPATTPILTTITNVAQQQQQLAMEEPIATEEESKPEVRVKKLKRRIFIGMIQSCWGYTKPKTKLLKAEPYAKRSYNAMPRYYVGKRKYLFYPIEEESSLTSMSESDEVKEPDGTEPEGKSFSPDSLREGDVARAILLGLNACGVAAVEVPAI